MKKNILKAVFVAAFAMMAGYGVYTTQIQTSLSDLALDNVEALASGETGGRGTLYGNSAGTRYCCCPGTNSCGAASCSGCPKL